MTGFLLRSGRVAGFVALTLAMMPLQAALLALGSRRAQHLPTVYHRLCCRIFGFRLARRGAPSTARPTLFVANHVSYFDITILGAMLDASFVAKAEVGRWPLVGWLAKLQRTVFVERADRFGAARQRDEIRDRLARGDNLILFPEGTSSDGIHILPFKTTLFAAAQDARVVVQPVTLAYRCLDGIPLGRFYRPFFAWYGDMTMWPHVWVALGMGQLLIAVEFHEPVRFTDFGSRKALSEHCRRVITDGLAAALGGNVAASPALAPGVAAQ